MMGPMKLSEIKAELKRTFKKTEDDPIEWLEQQVRERRQDQSKNPRSPEVLESILRVLKEATTKKSRKRKATRSKN